MATQNPEFATLFWNILSLTELLGDFSVEIDTKNILGSGESFETSKYSNKLFTTEPTRGVLNYQQIYEEVNPDNVFDNNSFYRRDDEDVYIESMPSAKIRLLVDGADDDTVFTGSLDNFNEILASIDREPGKIISYGGRNYEFITLVNEDNLFTADGFKSTSRSTAASLTNPVLVKEYDFEIGQIGTDIELARLFKISQSDSLSTWLSDGLVLVDGQEKKPTDYDDGSIPYFSNGFIFTLGGVYLGDFEEDYDYILNDLPDAKGSKEIDLNFYDASTVSEGIAKQVQELFPKEFSALNAGNAAPIFVGSEGSYLEFNWLTSMPASTSTYDQEVISLIGADAAIFSANQIYIALEDCDIITSSGKDLIILADDLNNTSIGNVPRVHDFEKGEDKILIPTEVFLGFGVNPTDKLPRTAFSTRNNATTEDHRIIYDSISGNMYHDIDGSGSATQQLIAVFINKPLLSETDIILGYGNGNDNGTPGSITGNGAFQEGATLTAPIVTKDVIIGTPLISARTFDLSTATSRVTGDDGIIDRFTLQTNSAPSTPFRITTFDPAEDFLQIPQELSGSAVQRSLFSVAKVVVPDRPLTKSEQKSFGKQQKAVSKSVKRIGRTGDGFAYNQLTGQLFIDTNGNKKEFGVGGGLLAVLEDTPAIGIGNFQFL